MKIEDLDLTVRTYNCLKRNGIDTVEQLQAATDAELMGIRGFGAGCLAEVCRVLRKAPAVPGPGAAEPNITELCFRNGEAHMKEKVIAALMDCKTQCKGAAHAHVVDIIRLVEGL